MKDVEKITNRFEVVDLLKCSIISDEIHKARILCKEHVSDRYKTLLVSDTKDVYTGRNIIEGDVVHVTGALAGDETDIIGEVVFSEDCLWVQNEKLKVAIPLWSETRMVEKLSSIYLDPTSASSYLN